MSEIMTTADLLRVATEAGYGSDVIQALIERHEREEARQALRAYLAAMVAFSREQPTIYKDREVKFGGTRYKHATLASITATLVGVLSQHGLTVSWRTSQTGGQVSVTCRVTHEAGHHEETSLSSPADTSGQKNAIQAIGSAVTYLQRYTLLALLGLAATDQDDDGLAAVSRWASPDDVARIHKAVEDLQIDEEAFFSWLGCDRSAMTEHDVSRAEAALAAKRRKAEKEMQG